MKKLIISISFFCLLTTICFIACKKSQEKTLTQHDKDLIALYSKIGDLHNKGMDFVYDKLSEMLKKRSSDHTNINGRINSDDSLALETLNQLVVDFVKNELQAQGITDFRPYYYDDLSMKDGFGSQTMPQRFLEWKNSTLSPELAAALNEFQITLLDADIYKIASKYDELLAKWIPQMFNDKDKEAFIAAVSTGKNSAIYWEENLTKWTTLTYQWAASANMETIRIDPKDVLMGDAMGAVGGLYSGAIAGAAGGTVLVPGIGTVTGAAAGGLVGMGVGAVTGSAGAILTSVVSWASGWWD